MPDMVPMTPQGLEKLKAELQQVEGRRPEILKAIKAAREQGDLSENVGYHAAREELQMIESKIEDLKGKISRAHIVDAGKLGGKEATFGATVRILDLVDNEEVEYTLVGAGEADVINNRILTTSPLGQAMLTKVVGDEFEVKGPRGVVKYRILGVSFA